MKLYALPFLFPCFAPRSIMPESLKDPQVLEREFLGIRAKLIEFSAALDRLDRAEAAADDRESTRFIAACESSPARPPAWPNKSEHIFSLPYQENWRD